MGSQTTVGGVGIFVKELCEKVVEVCRKGDSAMATKLVSGEEVMRVIYEHGLSLNRSN